MNTWDHFRALIACFLVTSGFFTWYHASAGIIFWTDLPLYGSISTFIIIGCELAIIVTVLLTALLANPPINTRISLVCDIVFIIGYYLILVNPPLAIIIPGRSNSIPVSLPVLLFGIGLTCELRNIAASLFHGNTLAMGSRVDDHENTTCDQGFSMVAAVVVSGILWGISVQYMAFLGTKWSNNLLAFILPGLFGVLATFNAVQIRMGRDESGMEAKLPTMAPIRRTGITPWKILACLGFGVSIILVLYGFQHAFFVPLPAILGYDMAIIHLVMIDGVAITLIVVNTLRNARIQPFKLPIKDLPLDLALMLVLGIAPYVVSGVLLETATQALNSWFLVGWIFMFPIYAVYALWKIIKGILLSMHVHREWGKRTRDGNGKQGNYPGQIVAIVVPLCCGLFLAFASFVIDYDHGKFEFYYGIMYFAFTATSIISVDILKAKYRRLFADRISKDNDMDVQLNQG
ncbi:hypothetical protein GF325_18120 [Candidatus Bathyarchaeota archaeon]|nr:hypothetical protein [Candidatus Bathyarchaeota archaeon]